MGDTIGEVQDRQRTVKALDKLAAAAERIADALERMAPPPLPKEEKTDGPH